MLETCGLSKKFVRSTFKKRREDVLFERERSLMPATQPLVEKALKIRRLELLIADIDTEIHKYLAAYGNMMRIPLQQIADELQTESTIDAGLERIARAHDAYNECVLLGNEKNKYQNQINFLNVQVVDTKREARKFIRACPQNGCSGFLSTAWKCGVCDHWACPTCHEPKDDGHECKPECIETAKMLDKDSKTCPSCAALIFKIDGCDQMFCTQCATAFSWRTGKVETGRIHNPHYYEYNRNRGRAQREVGDIPCGGMPDAGEIRTKCCALGVHPMFLLSVIRWHTHIVAVTQYEYNQRAQDNQDIRMKYMMKDITEEQFKQKIQAREKDSEKRLAITNVLNTYQVVTAEVMQRVSAAVTKEDIDAITPEFHEIRKYTNDLMAKISLRYQCVTPRITPELNIIKTKCPLYING
jgi:hypothetical protein